MHGLLTLQPLQKDAVSAILFAASAIILTKNLAITIIKNISVAKLTATLFVYLFSFFGEISFHNVNPKIKRPPIICITVIVSFKTTTDTRTATKGSI